MPETLYYDLSLSNPNMQPSESSGLSPRFGNQFFRAGGWLSIETAKDLEENLALTHERERIKLSLEAVEMNQRWEESQIGDQLRTIFRPVSGVVYKSLGMG